MQTQNLIEEQISSCRDLLEVFKDERETYGDSNGVNLDLVVTMIKRKQDILSTFGKQKDLMVSIRENGHENPESEKKLLRQLGSLLEQLLVIDQENEVLLRNIISKKPASNAQAKTTLSQSPELPFCPGQKQKKTFTPPTAVTPLQQTIAQPKSEQLQESMNRFSRNKLKAYASR
ncbi:MAG: hypothetical protein NE330_04285 [Lentisphaeraceae bacterium]|nr:hypothetical protein [Lentisphaeraceae bacterium]